MTSLKKIVFVAILALVAQNINSQEGLPIYSDYLTDNYYLLHPSMAGISNCNKTIMFHLICKYFFNRD